MNPIRNNSVHEWFLSNGVSFPNFPVLLFLPMYVCDELHFRIVSESERSWETRHWQFGVASSFGRFLLYQRWDLSGAHFLRIRVDYAHLWKETGLCYGARGGQRRIDAEWARIDRDSSIFRGWTAYFLGVEDVLQMKWDACILLLAPALGKMPYVLPSVDEFEVSRTSLLRFKFFVWIISGSETILGTADVEFGPRFCLCDIERRVLNDWTVVNSVSTEPVWIRNRIPNSMEQTVSRWSPIVQLMWGWIEYIIFWNKNNKKIYFILFQ